MNHELLSISLDNTGRRFNRDWIFRGVEYTFNSGSCYAILGPNGSGKSTLLQVINGSLGASAGKVSYSLNNLIIPQENIFQHLSIAAPYLELIEEFTLSEMVDFHFKFKPYLPGIDKNILIDLLNLPSAEHKQIKYFSSGMKQRLKLILAFCADTPLLMLDEPCSNLDSQGVEWYRSLVERFLANRLTIIGSNQPYEYDFCNYNLYITDYKK
ncbi:ABC transporter ATP-binding protein [Mucilaginibacter ginkgonis]|uniref:ATP-binding cassette domain-containing protein n=1 Tax=Mucilaginibacter ginkgonis TaxID=2682091 RepID=A0A6I4I062_9SPHI|nr:ATP-binding cassette domain-containing protein [Mucilaginibacter ginkgonis]QQL48853.1 ATP-binding cassette domain-containing protein [Mucilaginibacter ginkgonis]